MKTFTVIYRVGGTHRCEWRKTPVCQTRQEANERVADLERAGYKALVHDTDRLTAVGMPEGWDA